MELPNEIHEIRRWKPEPGDVLIFRNTEVFIDRRQAQEIEQQVRRKLDIGPEIRVAVIGRDWEFEVGKLPED